MEKIFSKNFVFDIIRSALLGIVFSIAFTMILGAIIHFTSIGDTAINIANIVVRAAAIMLGLCLGIRDKCHGLIKGLIVGAIYVLVTYVVFGLVGGDFKINTIKLIDSASSIIFAIISAIIAVNIKSKK